MSQFLTWSGSKHPKVSTKFLSSPWKYHCSRHSEPEDILPMFSSTELVTEYPEHKDPHTHELRSSGPHDSVHSFSAPINPGKPSLQKTKQKQQNCASKSRICLQQGEGGGGSKQKSNSVCWARRRDTKEGAHRRGSRHLSYHASRSQRNPQRALSRT